jgi:hypothetical protein
VTATLNEEKRPARNVLRRAVPAIALTSTSGAVARAIANSGQCSSVPSAHSEIHGVIGKRTATTITLQAATNEKLVVVSA